VPGLVFVPCGALHHEFLDAAVDQSNARDLDHSAVGWLSLCGTPWRPCSSFRQRTISAPNQAKSCTHQHVMRTRLHRFTFIQHSTARAKAGCRGTALRGSVCRSGFRKYLISSRLTVKAKITTARTAPMRQPRDPEVSSGGGRRCGYYMSRGSPRYWFHAKRYGYGWGLPATWEGWVVLVLRSSLLCLPPLSRPSEHVCPPGIHARDDRVAVEHLQSKGRTGAMALW
jgi:hypothetical protein